MKDVKNSFILLVTTFLTLGCHSLRAFQMDNFEDIHVITTKADRVRQKCAFLDAEAENNWRHQYVMYLLDGKNQVIEVMQSTHMDRDSCYSQMTEIKKLLKSDPAVKICVRNSLEKIDTSDLKTDFISFGSLGSHQISFEPLIFDSICSSKKCVGDNSAWVKTCPGFPKR